VTDATWPDCRWSERWFDGKSEKGMDLLEDRQVITKEPAVTADPSSGKPAATAGMVVGSQS